MKEYLEIFVDEDYPTFLDDYLKTDTMKRIQHVTQFCGCDYTNLYHPLFYYTRFDHSLVVAHMTWHFTHDKRETIAALLHDAGTPCFAHCIDYVFGDYMNQESSEKSIVDIASSDKALLNLLKRDGLSLEDVGDESSYPILENKSPKLCTDRLDGVLHTVSIWLCTHSFDEIKEVYDDMIVLQNEEGKPEIGFQSIDKALKFSSFVFEYALELQGNTDKYVMKYISEIVKKAVEKGLITLDDLYDKDEKEIVAIFSQNFSSWKIFQEALHVLGVEFEPKEYFVSFTTKKRNTIPLVFVDGKSVRITDVSLEAKKMYSDIDQFKASSYVYVKGLDCCD